MLVLVIGSGTACTPTDAGDEPSEAPSVTESEDEIQAPTSTPGVIDY